MKQEFFRTTLISKYIKQLLAKTPLPIYKLIYDNDDMVAGCLYTYKDKVLRCTKSGRFVGARGTLGRKDYLYVQEPLRVNDDTMTVYSLEDGEIVTNTVDFAVTDDMVKVDLYTPAEFEVVYRFIPEQYVPNVTEQYVSNISYYDEDTHYKLGEYLRYLNNLYNLNLMPLYNCFNYKVVDNVTLEPKAESKLLQSSSNKYKTYIIPIKFNKTYTIALQSDFPVMMKSIFYSDTLIKDRNRQQFLSDYIDETIVIHNNMQFNRPVTYRLSSNQSLCDYSLLHNYERYLYLAIQVTADNDSSVVVLEGDYLRNSGTIISDIYGINKDEITAEEVSSMLTSKLSLLNTNDGKQHPFADKLIQYLVRNTIDTREYIDDNVANVEKSINYYPQYRGMWDDRLRYLLFERYMQLTKHEELNFYDILGYVDSDIEEAIRKEYMK